MTFPGQTETSGFKKSWDEATISDWLDGHLSTPLAWIAQQLGNDELPWKLLVRKTSTSRYFVPFVKNSPLTGHDLHTAYVGKSKAQVHRALYLGMK